MPAAADKKRKKPDTSKASPAKKRKVETPAKKAPKHAEKKKTPTKAKPATKAKTPAKKAKQTPVKAKPTPAKKSTPASKVKKASNKDGKAKTNEKNSAKDTKKSNQVKQAAKAKPEKKAATPSSKSKPVKKEVKTTTPAKAKPAKPNKPIPKNNEKAKPQVKAKPKTLAAKAVTRAKVDVAKNKSAQAKVAQAKLKALKNLTKSKGAQNKPVPKTSKVASKQKDEENKKALNKKQEEKKSTTEDKEKKETKKEVEKKETKLTAIKKSQKQDSSDSKSTNDNNKRKAEAQVDVDTPRKRRIITPNKKYADFETDTSPKRISELRAFLQDKKKTPSIKEETETANKGNTPVKKVIKAIKVDYNKPQQSPEIKVIKASEMKPAEKLLKKLQKKLEREAKSPVTKQKSANKETAKTKISKVVTYNKTENTKATTKNLLQKEKVKPAVVVKKKATINAEKVTKIVPKTVQTPKKIKEQKKEERKIQTKFLFQKNVRQNDDASLTCWITGIDVYKSGEVVLVDMANKKIKLFTSTFEFMSQAKLDTTPQDISISPVDAGVAYFTKPFSKEGIQKVCLSDGILTLKDSILTNGTNRGIKCIKSGILTSVQNGRYHDLDINCFKIELLDYKGNVLQSVSADQTGVRLFKLPLYFTTNNADKQIIVSDCIRNNSYILSLDMTGKVRFKFTGVRDNPITPRGLTTDDENNIYVTEWERHNVYVLTPAGKRQQLLLDHTEQLKEGQDGLKKPYQLCFYKHEDGGRLIVSQESCNMIKVFQLGQKQPEQNGEVQAVTEVNEPTKNTNTPTTTQAPASPTKAQPATSTTAQPATPTKVQTATPTKVQPTVVVAATSPAKPAKAQPATPIKVQPSSPTKPQPTVVVASPAKSTQVQVVTSPVKPNSEPVKIIKIAPTSSQSANTKPATAIVIQAPADVTASASIATEVTASTSAFTEVTASTSTATEVTASTSTDNIVPETEVASQPATNILTQEHAYTTIVSSVQPTQTVVECATEEVVQAGADSIEDDNPVELSSLVDSIISDLKNRDPNSVLPTEEVVADQVLPSETIV